MASKVNFNNKIKKKRKNVTFAVANIRVTFNNTIVTFADSYGNVISSSSSGANSFKGARKSTPYAAQVTVSSAAKIAKECGVKTVYIKIKGPGIQRESALRAIFDFFVVTSIVDVSPIPHNGTKPKKRRRV